jgi:hypothetical protein
LNAQLSAQPDRGDRIGAQPIHSDVRGRRGQAVRFQLILESPRIVQKTAIEFDLCITEPSEHFELSL